MYSILILTLIYTIGIIYFFVTFVISAVRAGLCVIYFIIIIFFFLIRSRSIYYFSLYSNKRSILHRFRMTMNYYIYKKLRSIDQVCKQISIKKSVSFIGALTQIVTVISRLESLNSTIWTSPDFRYKKMKTDCLIGWKCNVWT